jgi:hypothetical protein
MPGAVNGSAGPSSSNDQLDTRVSWGFPLRSHPLCEGFVPKRNNMSIVEGSTGPGDRRRVRRPNNWSIMLCECLDLARSARVRYGTVGMGVLVLRICGGQDGQGAVEAGAG